MNEPKSLLTHLGEALDHYRAEQGRPADNSDNPLNFAICQLSL